jgi:small subunit ribosomal protein S6
MCVFTSQRLNDIIQSTSRYYIYSLPEKASCPKGGDRMRKYEIMYIVKTSLEDAARIELITNLHKILTDNKGVITTVDDWGVKELAYPIDFMTKGYYVVLKLDAEPETVKEFDRLARINTNVVRHMILNLEEQ